MGGEAGIDMQIKEVSIFKTKETMKSLSKDSFKGGKPEIGGALPPVIADKSEAESIKGNANLGTRVLDSLNSGNFFLMLVLKGSMEQLWGMIRAIQMIVLSALVALNLPTNLFIYLQICIVFA